MIIDCNYFGDFFPPQCIKFKMCMLIMCLDMSFTIVYHPIGLVMGIVARLTFSETVLKREVMAHCFALHFSVQ